jgi:hypothetical protein
MVMIGWAVGDITPVEPVLVSGQFHARISEKVLDPITATALAIGHGNSNKQAILLSCDLLWIDGLVLNSVREALGKRITDFDPKHLIINATHTHNGPETVDNMYPPAPEGVMSPAEYRECLIETLAEIATQAWNTREPGGFSRAFNYAVVGHNRRPTYSGGWSAMYGSVNRDDFVGLEGFEDHGLDMLFTWDADSNLTGIIINLACPSQVSEALSVISADFWHETRLAMKEAFGENLFILPQVSAAGDMSPHPIVHKTRETDMLSRMGLSLREAIARRITRAVIEVFDVVQKDISTHAEIAHTVKELNLPFRKLTAAEIAESQAEIERLTKELPASPEGITGDGTLSAKWVSREWHSGILERAKLQEQGATFKIEFNVFRLGDIAFCTNPFELYLDFGLAIKARSYAFQTFLIQLACGRGGWGGYLPTAKAESKGSYGAIPGSCSISADGGWLLVKETLAILKNMWK